MPMWIFVVVFAYVGSQLLFMSIAAIDEWLAKDHQPMGGYALAFWGILVAGSIILSMMLWDGKSYHF